MAAISDNIQSFIIKLIKNAQNNSIELQRNELALSLGCAPSQINYVLSTRFTLEHGYIISSKRGGGGYIRVCKINLCKCKIGEIISEQIGKEVSQKKAIAIINTLQENNLISQREKELIIIAISQEKLEDFERAKLLNKLFCVLIKNNQA